VQHLLQALQLMLTRVALQQLGVEQGVLAFLMQQVQHVQHLASCLLLQHSLLLLHVPLLAVALADQSQSTHLLLSTSTTPFALLHWQFQIYAYVTYLMFVTYLFGAVQKIK